MKTHSYVVLLMAGIFSIAKFTSATARTLLSDSIVSSEHTQVKCPVNLQLGARVDYQRTYQQSEAVKDECGFKGKHLVFIFNGHITPGLSYNFRQRLNEIHKNSNFFDGTDAMNLSYQFNEKWDVTAGKKAVALGGFEYAIDPLEVYFGSEFWHMFACYRFGVNLGYNVTPHDRLTVEFAESPFKKPHTDLYAYSFTWNGHHNWFTAYYSANVFEYNPGKFMYYLCLGHRFNFKQISLGVDYLNRASGNHAFFFKDCSVIAQIDYAPTANWTIFAKGSYERNATDDDADECIVAGTEITQLGAGVEFYPMARYRNLRMHAAYSYCFGQNKNVASALQDKQHFMTVGLQWRIDVVNLIKQMRNR